MPLKISNNAVSRLAANVSDTADTITLTPGDGLKFPAVVAGEYFPLTIIRASDSAMEIVKATARSTDVITVTRAREGTAALSFLAGDRVELRMTAATFSDEIARVETKADDAQDDATQALANAATAQSKADAALPKSGGVMTGPQTLSGDATENLHAVPKQQLDAGLAAKADAAALAEKADLFGGKVPISQLSFTQSLSANGYQKLPSGLIMQWGSVPLIAAGSSVTITYAIAFPTSVLALACGPGATGPAGPVFSGHAINTSQATFWNSSNTLTTNIGSYIAIGY